MFICLYKSNFLKRLIFHTKVLYYCCAFWNAFRQRISLLYRYMRGILCEIEQMMNVYSCGKYCSLARWYILAQNSPLPYQDIGVVGLFGALLILTCTKSWSAKSRFSMKNLRAYSQSREYLADILAGSAPLSIKNSHLTCCCWFTSYYTRDGFEWFESHVVKRKYNSVQVLGIRITSKWPTTPI